MSPFEYRILRMPEAPDPECADWLEAQADEGWEPFAAGADRMVWLRRPRWTEAERREHERRNAEATARLADGLAERRQRKAVP